MKSPLAHSAERSDSRYAFADELEDLAAASYLAAHPAGHISEFEYKGASYLFDDRQGIDRTILAMSPPSPPGLARDAYIQRAYPLSASTTRRPLDRGHFIPHSAGGDFGPNMFPQDRALNSGWSPDGRKYRALESAAIAAGPHALLFARPLYIDDSPVPAFIELGYWSAGSVTASVFRNRYDDAAMGDADRFEAAIGGATNAQAGALGEDTALVLLEGQGAEILGTDDAGMQRDGHRQGLDILALVGGSVVAYEVKTRHVGTLAGLRTRNGDLRRPRLRSTKGGPRQGSEAYVDVRANLIVDAGAEGGHPEVRVILVDFMAMLAQEFSVTRAGRGGPPVSPPVECEAAARKAYARISVYRGYL